MLDQRIGGPGVSGHSLEEVVDNENEGAENPEEEAPEDDSKKKGQALTWYVNKPLDSCTV